MKIVILSGSPHKNGTTAALADSFAAGAEAVGHTVTRFDTAFLDIHPCIACGKCRKTGKCVFEDDMATVRKALLEAEGVVLATPVYYFGMCAQLKACIDRFFGFNASMQKRKSTALLTAMADSTPETAAPIAANYHAMAEYLGWEDRGSVQAAGCPVPTVPEMSFYREKAYALGKAF